MPTTNDSLQDAAIRHQIYAIRLAGGEAKKIIALLNEVDDDIIRQIRARAPESGVWTTARLKALLNNVRKTNAKLYNAVGKTLTQDMVELGVYERDFQARLLSNTLPVALDVVSPALPLVHAAVTAKPFQGRLLSEWVTDLGAARMRELSSAIRIGVVEGETIDAIVRRVRGTKALNYKNGILDLGRRQAQALVRTAVNHTVTAARDSFYQANDDLISKVKWISTLDGKTTPICRSRDGKLYPVDEGARPPAHIGCRSTIAPVVRSWKELGVDLKEAPPGTRASLDGQVAEDINYNDWLKTQPAGFQDGVLGKTKGKLYRQGGVTMDRFVDRTGNELTLAQLRVTEAAAFTKAGL